jgi:hypothetical protein
MVNQLCNICKKRVKQHDNFATCSLCNHPSHFKCLPIYSIEDNIYATNPNGHWSCTNCLSDIFPFSSIEDDDLIQAVINKQSEHIHDIDALNNLIFQPFEINELDEISDLDPDSNYYNPLINQNITGCKYLNFEQLNSETNSRTQNICSNMSFNICSLPKNHRQLITLLDTIDVQFHTISLTETWLQEHNQDLYELEGYHHVHKIRQNKNGGGLSIFVKNNINFKIRNDLNHNNHDHQFLWLELDRLDINSKTNLIIGVIYKL